MTFKEIEEAPIGTIFAFNPESGPRGIIEKMKFSMELPHYGTLWYKGILLSSGSANPKLVFLSVKNNHIPVTEASSEWYSTSKANFRLAKGKIIESVFIYKVEWSLEI